MTLPTPLFVYDDDCGFCTWWAEFVEDHADLDVVGFSSMDAAIRERLPADYEQCSHLLVGDAVYSCGAGIEEALLRTGVGAPGRPVVEFLRRFETYRSVREWGYRLGADNRVLGGKVVSETPPAREQ